MKRAPKVAAVAAEATSGANIRFMPLASPAQHGFVCGCDCDCRVRRSSVHSHACGGCDPDEKWEGLAQQAPPLQVQVRSTCM